MIHLSSQMKRNENTFMQTINVIVDRPIYNSASDRQ